MADENESTIADATGPIEPGSPVESPAEVRKTFRGISDEACLALGFDRAAFRALPRPYSYDHREQTYLYVMKCDRFHKVGIASNVQKRLTSIQAVNPLPVKVRHTRLFSSRLYALMTEAQAHKALAAYHLHGEWFTADFDHIKRILRLIYPVMAANERRYAAEKAEYDRQERLRYETDPAYRMERDAESAAIAADYERYRTELMASGPTIEE